MAELLSELKGHEILQVAVLVIAFLVWLGAYMRGKAARGEPERRDPYGTTTEAFFGGPVTEALAALRDVAGAVKENTRMLGEMRTEAAKQANENNEKLDEQTVEIRAQNILLRDMRDGRFNGGPARRRPQR